MPNFDQTVIKIARNSAPGNMHIAVHPMPLDHLWMLMSKRDRYEDVYREDEVLPEYLTRLVNDLWGLPGVRTIFLGNGEITLQHIELFAESEIFEAAKELIEPVLAQNLLLAQAN